MITDISTITKLEEVPEQFKIEDVNIKDTFNDIIEELAEQISAHRFSVLNELPPVCIHANFSLIYAIFRNLVENSLKYAGECCNIYISYSSRGRGIHEFDYHDTGRGVPEDKLDRIFERFYRLDEDRSSEKGGSGLGLSIVRNSVLFHKGTIFAYNVQGGGLGFHFTLKDLS
jgi:two-component system phosphate regulon sensor histidine kinase PhoR